MPRRAKRAISTRLGCGRNPRLEPVPLPAVGSQQHGPNSLHEQHPEISITTLGNAAENGTTAGRHLFGHKAKPSTEIATLGEYLTCAAATVAVEMIGPMPEPSLDVWLVILPGHSLDALVQPPPVDTQILDDVDHQNSAICSSSGRFVVTR